MAPEQLKPQVDQMQADLQRSADSLRKMIDGPGFIDWGEADFIQGGLLVVENNLKDVMAQSRKIRKACTPLLTFPYGTAPKPKEAPDA